MKINVYENELDRFEAECILGVVESNNNLDAWNGSRWQNGANGMHKGIHKTKTNKYILIITNDFSEEHSYAYFIDEDLAVKEILLAGQHELLDEFGLSEKVTEF